MGAESVGNTTATEYGYMYSALLQIQDINTVSTATDSGYGYSPNNTTNTGYGHSVSSTTNTDYEPVSAALHVHDLDTVAAT